MQSLKASAVMLALAGSVTMFSVGAASAVPLSASAAALNSASQADAQSLITDVQFRRYRGYRGYYGRREGNLAPAIIGGIIIGGIIASQANRQYYYNDAVSYCRSRFRSYDPYSGTYLGYDGYRHPCP